MKQHNRRSFIFRSVAEGNFHIKLIEATNFTPGGALDDGLITVGIFLLDW